MRAKEAVDPNLILMRLVYHKHKHVELEKVLTFRTFNFVWLAFCLLCSDFYENVLFLPLKQRTMMVMKAPAEVDGMLNKALIEYKGIEPRKRGYPHGLSKKSTRRYIR